MKLCPICENQYEDSSMRFCTRDGTPLISLEAPPNQLSSNVGVESDSVKHQPAAQEKLVAPVAEQRPRQTGSLPPLESAVAQPTPTKPKSSGGLILVLGLVTLFVVAAAAAIGAGFYYFGSQRTEVAIANTNVNAAANNNLSSADNSLTNNNLDVPVNSNLDANVNLNLNNNLNANAKPSPKPSPSASRNANANSNQINLSANANAATNPTTPGVSPKPTAAASPQPSKPRLVVSGGIVNGLATSLPRPAYPPAAKAVRAGGAVNVQVVIDEKGAVVQAKAVSGHALLRPAAVQAARQARFQPTLLSGQPVRTTGVIVYNFVSEQ